MVGPVTQVWRVWGQGSALTQKNFFRFTIPFIKFFFFWFTGGNSNGLTHEIVFVKVCVCVYLSTYVVCTHPREQNRLIMVKAAFT